jgi:hypothetical protein
MKNASMVFEIFDFQKAERKKMQIDTKMPCPSGKKAPCLSYITLKETPLPPPAKKAS